MATILVFHGWGFDRTCWHNWLESFMAEGHQVQAFDRGYFDGAIAHPYPLASASSWTTFEVHSEKELEAPTHPPQIPQRILIVHSFGLHLCPIETIQQSDRVVIFSSFLCFHPEASQLNRRSKRVVKQMGDRLQTHAIEVLQKFWANCYAPISADDFFTTDPPPLDRCEINIPLLAEDLERLNSVIVNESSPLLNALRSVPNITIIHGEADQIVPLSQGATLADAVSAPLITVPDAGHALPFSHSDQCWALASFTNWL